MKTILLITIAVVLLPFSGIGISAENSKRIIYSNIQIIGNKCIKKIISYNESLSTPLQKHIYTYNNQRNIQSIVICKWDKNAHKWIYKQKSEYTYDEEKKLQNIRVIYWNHKTKKWDNKSGQMLYSYDHNGNLLSIAKRQADNNLVLLVQK